MGLQFISFATVKQFEPSILCDVIRIVYCISDEIYFKMRYIMLSSFWRILIGEWENFKNNLYSNNLCNMRPVSYMKVRKLETTNYDLRKKWLLLRNLELNDDGFEEVSLLIIFDSKSNNQKMLAKKAFREKKNNFFPQPSITLYFYELVLETSTTKLNY